MNEILIIVAGALIQGVVGFLFWVMAQRNVEKFDRIQRELQELKDNRVAGIEEALKNCIEHDARKREWIYGELQRIEKRSVNIVECKDAHKELRETIAEFLSATSDMARSEERIAVVMEQLRDFNERLISVKEDIDKHVGEAKRHG